MKIGLLTSSRADFGIYYPLANKLSKDNLFNLEIIAFGTHLSEDHGYTLSEIENLGFEVKHKIKTLTNNSNPSDIANSIGDTVIKFAEFWQENSFDLVIALGDRYEMFAAVSAASPFNIKIAHIHAGETTLGAIDNAYRHSISTMSEYLFVSNETYKNRALEISENPDNVFNVGALSIDNLMNQEFFSLEQFKNKFDIDLTLQSILTTFHPETVSFDKNKIYIKELLIALQKISKKYQIIITMPNSDTMGNMIREQIVEFGNNNTNVKLIESFGMKGYLTAMKNCEMMIGNTSSGFVEASFFPKWVINVGDRQKGRIITPNILSVEVNSEKIINTVEQIENKKLSFDSNVYGVGNTSEQIISTIKKVYGFK